MKAFDIQGLVRENVRSLKPYSSARDDFKGEASVYLDANENPNNNGYNRYPDPHQTALREKIGHMRNVSPSCVFLGNGSDEPIDLLFRAFCSPGIHNAVVPEPTYGMYSVSAAVNDVEVRRVNLTPEFELDTDAVETASNKNSRLLFLCSPNNPSGNLLAPEKIIYLLGKFPGIVVVDEAYIDFTGAAGFLPDLKKYPNLVILQTFSKAWGLAGIRLGMCFAAPEIIAVLNKIKPPYNISILTQRVALAHLNEEKQKDQWVREIVDEREGLRRALGLLNPVEKIYRSDANFLLVKIAGAKNIYNGLVERGIIVRDRSSVTLGDCLRITVGSPDENLILTEALRQL